MHGWSLTARSNHFMHIYPPHTHTHTETMADVDSGGFETKGIGLWIEAFGPERVVPWPAFVEAIQVRTYIGWQAKPP